MTKGTKKRNHYMLIVFDSCRYDTFRAAAPKNILRLGGLERRWSYASWTAPSHYNLLCGLLPHTNPRGIFAADYYQMEFRRFNERLGYDSISFQSMTPSLYLPLFLQRKLRYRTHARVSLPVLNPATILNCGFDTYKLMARHNDMRAMLSDLAFEGDGPSFHMLNVGETHYPYALQGHDSSDWLRLNGLHGVLRHMDDAFTESEVTNGLRCERFFTQSQMKEMKARQVEAVRYLDGVVEELFDLVPRDTFITITSDHGELFGEGGFFGHGPVQHPKVLEVPLVEGKIR